MQRPPGVSMPTVNLNRTCGRTLRLCPGRILSTGDLNSRSTTRTYRVLTDEEHMLRTECAVVSFIIRYCLKILLKMFTGCLVETSAYQDLDPAVHNKGFFHFQESMKAHGTHYMCL